MNFFDVVNGYLLYGLCGGTILFVLIFAIETYMKSYKRALEIGIKKTTLKKVKKSTIAFAVIPSIGVTIGFFAMAPLLGIPWSWLRLSIIGGLGYELMAADIATNAMGITLAQIATSGLSTMVNVMFVMAICITPGLIILTIFGDKTITVTKRLVSSKGEFGKIARNCLMLNMLSVFIPDVISRTHIHTLVFITSIFFTLGIGAINNRFKFNWLSNYGAVISMVLGMASGVLYLKVL